MAEHATTFTEAELEATTLVRVAEKCDFTTTDPRYKQGDTCPACGGTGFKPCPYEVGDVLFHQEEWHSIYGPDQPIANDDPYMFYRANQDDPAAEVPGLEWFPADTMPFWASRHRRTVASVELVRLHEIGAYAWTWLYPAPSEATPNVPDIPPVDSIFVDAERWWDANKPEHPWASNPMVWKIGVKQEDKNDT